MKNQQTHSVPLPYRMHRIGRHEAASLMSFYNSLSPASKRTFRPLGIETDLDACEAICAENEKKQANRYDLVATLDDDFVGWCFLWDVLRDKPSLGLGISDAHQGRGLGQAMMSAVMAWARQRQLPAVHLIAVQDNQIAIRLYESFGFVARGQHINEKDGLTYSEMTAPLSNPNHGNEQT